MLRRSVRPAPAQTLVIDLIGELDSALAVNLDSLLGELGPPSGPVVVTFERIDSTQWAGLCDTAEVMRRHRSVGRDIRASARLRRVRAVLDEFGVPCDAPSGANLGTHRHAIVARTPRPQVA